jgi:hydrogenase nickel incorporation protein HypB
MNNSYNERSMKIIDLKKTILEDNDADADRLREELKKKNVFYMNVMSSPGSGKTTTIVGTIERLRKHFNIGVMEADIDSDVDALYLLESTPSFNVWPVVKPREFARPYRCIRSASR